jgi:hypothetical protein
MSLRAGLLFLAAVWCASAAHAQVVPRTPEGRPDFQGVWANNWLTRLEKGGRYNTLVVPKEQADIIVKSHLDMAKMAAEQARDPEIDNPEAKTLAIVRGEYRSHLIVSPETGRLPMTAEGQKAYRAFSAWMGLRMLQAVGEGPEDRLSWERCLAGNGQAPLLINWQVLGHRRIVQTKDALVIHSEAGGETRIIRIGGKPLPDGLRSFIGDSVARWEGDTLVVETTGFKPEDQFRLAIWDSPIMVSPDAKVVERFQLLGDGELNYQFGVEDPVNYSQPWFAEYSMMRSKQAMFEFACHEGNYGLPNILAGARAAERRAGK